MPGPKVWALEFTILTVLLTVKELRSDIEKNKLLIKQKRKYVLCLLSGAGQLVYRGFFKVSPSETATC